MRAAVKARTTDAHKKAASRRLFQLAEGITSQRWQERQRRLQRQRQQRQEPMRRQQEPVRQRQEPMRQQQVLEQVRVQQLVLVPVLELLPSCRKQPEQQRQR